MSFDGDLEHLPIVDVIQLLHATGKSGTLTLRSLKGESQLVFHSGYIVSANHVNNSLRIGQVLIDLKMISYEDLESALQEQQKAGPARKPIIQTMIEAGKIRTEDAYQGLEVLIEMTIVEVLTWNRGTFSLDVEKTFVSDEYRYFPEQLKKEIQLNTQNVLMDALRIYDERKRDGTLSPEAIFAPPPAVAATTTGEEISAADLGLDDLEALESKLATPFTGLADQPLESPRTRLQQVLAGIPSPDQERLFGYLDGLAGQAAPPPGGAGVILLTGDRLLRECVAAACGSNFRCATDDTAALDLIIEQSLSKGVAPLLLVDPGEPGRRTGERDAAVELVLQKRARHPELRALIFAGPGDFSLTTRALREGLGPVLPRPGREERPESFIADSIDCTQALVRQLRETAGGETAPRVSQAPPEKLRERFLALSQQREPAEVTFQLLQAVAGLARRALTMVAVRSELIAERGIGIDGSGVVSPVKLRIPLSDDSLFRQAVQEGRSYLGAPDAALQDTLLATIGPPAGEEVLLLPVQSFGRVIALIYAEFPAQTAQSQRDLLETLALHAGVVIDNALYRKRVAQQPAA